MGILAWNDITESKALLEAQGMYFEGPNRYDFSPGIYIAVILNYLTDHRNIRDMLRDALEILDARLQSRIFRNPQRPVPGRRALWFKLEPRNRDAPPSPLPRPENAYRAVYGLVLRLKRSIGRDIALPLRWRQLKIFWREISPAEELPSVVVHDPALLEGPAPQEGAAEGEGRVITEVEAEGLENQEEESVAQN
ncbi:uncharacterized protein ACLA_018760 [Aspergillus clavatus NRRL 1]|uniref:Uncharacterized protein n=1 Tax=Aspergillus clavatus (strain ATCC 1007 / CBS 513.65 / DSM 816 / NCTC 3887 / NRRL 1 / QM 1276 / 107) TaxID=344612 RepID=A1CNF1_ASPCL|nr:uncharacterized protein ACLA_018760 [Aspergillus clavatus NRRL 1]EAW07172.1 conserved hypothetical protein [Aspergillus clavatus NRRL 1]